MTTVKLSQPVQAVLDGCESISHGLGLIEDQKHALSGLSPSALVDIAARLNQQKCFIEDLVDPMKDLIKTQAYVDDPKADNVSIKGKVYQAVVRRITKRVLMTEEIKKFLGNKLGKFQRDRVEVSVCFEIKS